MGADASPAGASIAGGAAGDITAGVFGAGASAGFSGVAAGGLADAPAIPLATVVGGAAFGTLGRGAPLFPAGALTAGGVGGGSADGDELQASHASADDVSQIARVLIFTPFVCVAKPSTTTRFS